MSRISLDQANTIIAGAFAKGAALGLWTAKRHGVKGVEEALAKAAEPVRP